MNSLKPVEQSIFYSNPLKVAYNLLGKILEINGRKGRLLDLEVYCILNDPACHSHRYVKNIGMLKPGTLFVYPVHGYWMLNFIAGVKPKGVVFIRRVATGKCYDKIVKGPGLTSRFFEVNPEINGAMLGSEYSLYEDSITVEPRFVRSSKRIGLKKDLDPNLRFYIDIRYYKRLVSSFCKHS